MFCITGHLKEDIVNKLSTIPNFLDNVLVKHLKESIPIPNPLNVLNDTLTKLIPLNFQEYLQLKTESITEALNKVADVTSNYMNYL